MHMIADDDDPLARKCILATTVLPVTGFESQYSLVFGSFQRGGSGRSLTPSIWPIRLNTYNPNSSADCAHIQTKSSTNMCVGQDPSNAPIGSRV